MIQNQIMEYGLIAYASEDTVYDALHEK